MKVLYHIPFPVIGGAETQIQYLIRNLSSDYRVFITYEHAEVAEFVKALNVPSKRVFSPNSLAQAINLFQPNIIQFYHSHTMFSALRKARMNAKVVEVVHNRLPFPGDAASYPKNFTHAVVGVSPDAAAYFQSVCPDVPTVVIPNGVDTLTFKPGSPRPKRKRLLGGFSGRLESGPGKGIPELIEIVRQVPEIDFELIGHDYGNFAATTNVPNLRIIPRHHHAIVQKYHEWDFFVSRSPSEGFGLSIAEALACGLPSVVFNCGGVVQFLEPGKTAIIANTDDEMVAGIRKIVAGISLSPTKVDLSAERMAAGYKSLYYKLHTGLELKKAPQLPPVSAPQSVTRLQREVSKIERLAVVEKSWHGVKRALEPITDAVTDPDQAMQKMRELRPKVLVLGCYMPHWDAILHEAKRLKIKVVCTWHASFILNEFDHVNRIWMAAMIRAYKDGLIHVVATPHLGLAETFKHYGIEAQFLPNVLPKELKPVPKLPSINIGILGSGQAWKNMECQIIAAGMIPNAKIHIQKLQHPEIVNALGLSSRVITHPHIKSDDEYYRLVGGMTINMVVSLSEVYSYFAAESMLLGTPVLTSSITPILKGAQYPLSFCRTPYFEDPMEILKSLTLIQEKYDEIRSQGWSWMSELNKHLAKKVQATVAGWSE